MLPRPSRRAWRRVPAAVRAAARQPRARRVTRAGELTGEEGRELRGADTSRREQQAHAGAAHARRIALSCEALDQSPIEFGIKPGTGGAAEKLAQSDQRLHDAPLRFALAAGANILAEVNRTLIRRAEHVRDVG